MHSKVQGKQKELVIISSLDKEEMEELEKEVNALGLVYWDTLCSIDMGTSYKRGELYQMFKEGTYLELPLLLEEVNLDFGVYQQIKKLGLHKVIARFVVFPCVEVISWLISQANIQTS